MMILRKQFKEKELKNKQLRLVLNRIPEDIYRKCLTGSINVNHITMQVSVPQNAKESSIQSNQHNPIFEENMNDHFAANSCSMYESTSVTCDLANEKKASSNSLIDSKSVLLNIDAVAKSKSSCNFSDVAYGHHQNFHHKRILFPQNIVQNNRNELKQKSYNSLVNKKVYKAISKAKKKKNFENKILASKQQSSKEPAKNLQVVCERLPHDIYQIYAKHLSVSKGSESNNIVCNLQNVQGAVNFAEAQNKQANVVTSESSEKNHKHDTNNKNTDSDLESEIRPVHTHFNKTFGTKDIASTHKNPGSEVEEYTHITLLKCLQNENRFLPSSSLANISYSNSEKNNSESANANSSHFNYEKKKKKHFEKVNCGKSKIHAKSCVKHKKSSKEKLTSVNTLTAKSKLSNSYNLKNRKFKSVVKRKRSEKTVAEQGNRISNTVDFSARTSEEKFKHFSDVFPAQNKADNNVAQNTKQKSSKKNVKPKPVKKCKYCRKLAIKNIINETKPNNLIKITKKESSAHKIIPGLQNIVAKESCSFTENLNSQHFTPGVNKISGTFSASQIKIPKHTVNEDTSFEYLKRKCRCHKLLKERLKVKREKLKAKKQVKKALKEKKCFDKSASKILSSENVTLSIESLNFNENSKSAFLKNNSDCEDINKESKPVNGLKTKSKKNCTEPLKKLPLIENAALELKNMSSVPLITSANTLTSLKTLNTVQVKTDKTSKKNISNGRGKLNKRARMSHMERKKHVELLCNKKTTDKNNLESADISVNQFCSKRNLPLLSGNFTAGTTNSSSKSPKRPKQKIKRSLKYEHLTKECKTSLLLKRKLENKMRKMKPKYVERTTKKESLCVTSQDIENMTAIQFISLLSHNKSLASYFIKILNESYEKQNGKFQSAPLAVTELKSKRFTNGFKCVNIMKKNLKLKKKSKLAEEKENKNSAYTSLKFQNKSKTKMDLRKISISKKTTKNLSKIQNKFCKNHSQETKLKMNCLKQIKTKNKSKTFQKKKFALLESDAKVAMQSSDLKKQNVSVDIPKKAAFDYQSKQNSNYKTLKGVLTKFSDNTKSHITSVLKRYSPHKSPAPKKVKFNLDVNKDKGSFHPSSTSGNDLLANGFGIKPVQVVLKPISIESNLCSSEEDGCPLLEKHNKRKKNISPQFSFCENDSSAQVGSPSLKSDKRVIEIPDDNGFNQDLEPDLVETCMSEASNIVLNNQKENVKNNIFIDSKSLVKKVKNKTKSKTFSSTHNLWKYKLGLLQKNKLRRTQHALSLCNKRRVLFKTKVNSEK